MLPLSTGTRHFVEEVEKGLEELQKNNVTDQVLPFKLNVIKPI